MARKFMTSVAAGLMLAIVATVLAPSVVLAGPPKGPLVKGPHFLPVYGYHHHYFPHYGYGTIYVGPGVVYPVAPIIAPAVAPIIISSTPHTLFYIGPDGQTRVYGSYVQTVYSNGTMQLGGMAEAQASLTAAGITNWVDAPQPVAPN
jgi:hypothetical protein